MNFNLKGSFVLFFCLLSRSVFADFSSAMVDYQEKKYPEAMVELKRIASLGHKDSQFNIGAMYYRGEGVEKNPIEAYGWMALSAESGSEGHAKIRDVVQSKLSPKEATLALARAEELLKQYGEAAIQKNLSPVLLSDEDCVFKTEKIQLMQPVYPDSAQNEGIMGTVDVSYDLDANGFARNYAVIVATNEVFIAPTMKAMADLRFQPYMVSGKPTPVIGKKIRVNYRLQDSKLDKKKLQSYMASLKEKAVMGSSYEKYVYAYAMDIVPEIQYEKKEINEWMYASAQMGFPAAQYQLGRNLLYGEGCEVDNNKASQWLTLSARSSSPDAQYFLGSNMLIGSTFEKNKRQGIEWLNHAAAAHHQKALVKLAWIYSVDSEADIYNPKRALELIGSVYESYGDKLTISETLAVAQAANQMFDEAIKNQQAAIAIAKKIKNMPTDVLEQRLAMYKSHQALRE